MEKFNNETNKMEKFNNETNLHDQQQQHPISNDHYAAGNETESVETTEPYHLPTLASSSSSDDGIIPTKHVNDASQMMRDMAFIWLALFAFYYVCGPRRSRVTIDERVVNERLRQIRDEEVAKKRRLNPDKRKEEINEQVMTGIITKFDAAKFRFAGMKKKALHPHEGGLPNIDEKNCAASISHTTQCIDSTTSNDEIQFTYCGDCETGGKQFNSNSESNDQYLPEHGTDVDMECSVCLEVFEPGEKLVWSRNLKCQHVFHHECLMPWLMTHDECPYCRTKMIDDCDTDTSTRESIEAIIYSDFNSVDNGGGSNDDEENPLDDNIYGRLKHFMRRSIGHFQSQQRVTRIGSERTGTMTFQEYLMDF